MLYIQKRDNTLEPFNKDKIITAINKAFLEVDKVLLYWTLSYKLF